MGYATGPGAPDKMALVIMPAILFYPARDFSYQFTAHQQNPEMDVVTNSFLNHTVLSCQT